MAKPHQALIELAAGRPLPRRVPDPALLVRSAIEHRVDGLLWRAVQEGQISMPASEQRVLAGLSLRTRARNARLWDVLEETTTLLAAEGIEVASAKGVTSESRWYEQAGTRPALDLDLFLRPDHLKRAREVVEIIQPSHALVESVADLARTGRLQSIDIRFRGVDVDLHFDILKFEIETKQNELIWDRTELVPTPNGGIVRVLDPEMSLILALLHLNKDRFAYLLGFVDVVRIIEQERLDWAFVDRFLRVEGIESHIYSALDVIFETLHLETPEHPVQSGWRSAFWKRLWPEQMRLNGDVGRVSNRRRKYLIGATARGRSLEAAWRRLQRMFPPKELLDYYHPRRGGPYLWRLMRGHFDSARTYDQLTAQLTE